MNRVMKLSFVCASLFAFIYADAQVIESVSFTPAKTGKYDTIVTKSHTSFVGDLAVNDINGLGDKLILDTNSKLPISSGSSTIFGAGRDVYMVVNGFLPKFNTIKIGDKGNFYNIKDIEIKNLKVKQIYGSTTNFSNTSVVLAEDGSIEFNGVVMNNPGCDIKWVQLPAYKISEDYSGPSGTVSSNPTKYWIAYCEVTTQNTSGSWTGTVEDARLVGTCTDGWDGTETGSNGCTYNSNATSGTFTCSSRTIAKCTSPVLQGTPLPNNISENSCTNRTDVSTSFSGEYRANWTNVAKCNGYQRPKAVEIYNQTIPATTNSYRLRLPSSNITVKCLHNMSNASETVKENYRIGLRKAFCGFSASTSTAADNAIRNFHGSGCINSTTTNVPQEFCADLYGSGYDPITLSNNTICSTIAARNTSLGHNTFRCIKKGPSDKNYKAYMEKKCSSKKATIETCKASWVCNGVRRCPKAKIRYEDKEYDQVFNSPWENNYDDMGGLVFLDCLSSEALKNAPAYDSSKYRIKYLNQVEEDGKILTCTYTE